MHKNRSTNVFALLFITLIAALTTRLLLSKITLPAAQPIYPLPHLEQQTTNDTSLATFNTLIAQGWKSYRNDEMGIEFAYPKGGEVQNKEGDISLLFKSIPFEVDSTYVHNFSLDVFFEKDSNIQQLGIEQWYIENWQDTTRQAPVPDEEKVLKIGNENSYFTRYINQGLYGSLLYDFVEVLIPHNDNVIIMRSLVSPKKPRQQNPLPSEYLIAAQQYESDFNQILASFHFTN